MKLLLAVIGLFLASGITAQSSIGLSSKDVLSDYRQAGYTPREVRDEAGTYSVEVDVEGAVMVHYFNAMNVCNAMRVYPSDAGAQAWYAQTYTRTYTRTSETSWQAPGQTITLVCSEKDKTACYFEWR